MPICEKLRGSDYPTIRNYLRVTMCNIWDELTKRTDARALAAFLCGLRRPRRTGSSERHAIAITLSDAP